ncbi:MAG: cobalt-factor II C(20)-methyltransferase [Methanomassiliicoccus sp.]|jgi:precorrin-2/cobalt-factor-2 C20-methyltransferase|nr:cobalt-factor II C(20)-methyltransferase [Methanomassiliicoccus sp.]
MLIALGIGPGESDLITVRGAKLLAEADKVFVPGRIARDIVAPFADAEMLDFPMTDDYEKVRAAMERNCAAIAPAARSGTAVLGILGDPGFYSTFGRLCDVMRHNYPDIEFKVEPGISSITAFASRLNLSVNSGLLVTDGSEQRCLVHLKVRAPRDMMNDLRSQGYNEFHLVERMHMNGERVYREDDMPETCDYMSVLFARRA